jgi:hypothetical protein
LLEEAVNEDECAPGRRGRRAGSGCRSAWKKREERELVDRVSLRDDAGRVPVVEPRSSGRAARRARPGRCRRGRRRNRSPRPRRGSPPRGARAEAHRRGERVPAKVATARL